MPTVDALRSRRMEILATAIRHGARKVRVFGSVARCSDMSDSDVDLLVDFEPERSLYALVGLQLEIEFLLGRRADVVTEGSFSAYLR